MTTPYLERLAAGLLEGAARLPRVQTERHAAFLLQAQQPDGGFAGREGPSDPYYTSFALRAAVLVGALRDEVAHRANAFLQTLPLKQLPLIDLVAAIFAVATLDRAGYPSPLSGANSPWRRTALRRLAAQRRPDGGFAKTPQAPTSSTYFSFLATIAHEALGRTLEHAESMVQFIRSRHRDDGGFVEFGPMPRSATNPTAAAVAVLHQLDALDRPTREAAARFLCGMQTDEGGFSANTRIGLADLLSTFTAWLSLNDLGHTEAIDIQRLARYVESLQHTSGGYRAATWDDARDVEYTFYGLGTAALLARDTPPGT